MIRAKAFTCGKMATVCVFVASPAPIFAQGAEEESVSIPKRWTPFMYSYFELAAGYLASRLNSSSLGYLTDRAAGRGTLSNCGSP